METYDMQNKRIQRGQGMTEYVILIAVIAIAGIALVTGFGDSLANWFDGVTGTVGALPTS